MKRKLITLLLALTTLGAWATTENNPTAVVSLVNRVCGAGASDHFSFTLDDTFNGGAEAFQLGAAGGKVTVTANTMSALTTGLNWYLNHEAHVNIAWNNLTQTPASYPAPTDTQVHTARGQYRYYLNYCTFSYSMSFWDEDRWMKEIDWMALHGVNLPLQIVGMDAVWYYMLRERFGFSHDEASGFVAGPAFQGWWLMNNLTGHGGKNPEWWYARQAELGRKITDRMRELGMAPCLPGYVGMAPQKYVTDTGATSYTGSWCGFTAPLLLAPGDAYTAMAAQYYAYIQKIFGFMPTSFSIDPAHERAVPSGMNYQDACSAARTAMNAASPNALWVAQEWQVNASQSRIDALPVENTLLLDLSSERLSYTASGHGGGSGYGSHEYLFCMLHNYGGNVGMYGCMMQMLANYTSHLSTGIANGSKGTLKGVGATPEGIETNPVLYDLLFELPWLSTVPSADQWLADYTISRYGTNNANAKAAWENLRTTVYANTKDNQQGCREPVFCSRPNLSGNDASSWAKATYDWDKNKVIEAAEKLLSVGASGTNYEYDVVDFVRQAITDYAHTLQMDMAGQNPRGARFAEQADGFLTMMDDVDELLGTISDFRMGKWAGAARKIATESGNKVYGTGTWSANAADANWLELNSRMLVTTWGNTGAATNQGGLRDYGNREWQGLIRDYYKPRWVRYFNDMKNSGSCGVNAWTWMAHYEWPYVYGKTIGTEMSTPSADLYADASGLTYSQTYSATPEGDPLTVAAAKFHKYFGKLKNGKYYSPNVTVAASDIKIAVKTAADLSNVFKTMTTGSSIAKFNFDMDGDGRFDEANDKNIGDWEELNTVSVTVPARVITTDGAIVTFLATIGEDLDAPRTVTVATSDATMGSVKIKGYTAKSVSNTKAVTVIATANEGHQFLFWKDSEGNVISTIPTFNYALSESIGLTACFKRWVDVEQSSVAISETKQHSAYLTSISYKAGSATDFTTIYTANAAPTSNVFCILENVITANAGDQVTIKWTGAAGMQYCYLSAYFDTDANGIFDTTPFATLGTNGAANSTVTNNQITLQIPDNAKGLTRVRLRFDGAWNGGWNSSISAWPAQAVTNRPVYDINVNIPGDDTSTYKWGDVQKSTTTVDGTWYLNNLTLTTKNNAEDAGVSTHVIVNRTTDPNVPHVKLITPTQVKPGQTLDVAWDGVDNMDMALLSAYIDYNGDGTFDASSSSSIELLGMAGSQRSGVHANTAMRNNHFTINLPATVSETFKLGETRLRLRFDYADKAKDGTLQTSWNSANTNLFTGTSGWFAYLPTVVTQGIVYDVPIEICDINEPWSKVTETGGGGSSAPGGANSEDGKNHDSGAWLTSLTINGKEVYTNSNTDPVQTVIDAVSQVTLNPGGTYTVEWTANDQMKWARLTAYYDLDGDGTFEEATADNAGDCLGVMGGFKPNSSTGNESLPNNSFTFTLPADAAIGVSCLRLRFDDAWQNPTGVNNSTTELGGSNQAQPMLSTSRSSRNVYDVHVAIEEPQWENAEITIGGLVFDGIVSKNSNEAVLNEYTSGLGNNVTLTHAATAGGKEYTVADLTPVFDVIKDVNSATTVTIASDVESLGEAYAAYVPKRSAGYENGKAVSATNDGVTYNGTQYQWDLLPTLKGNCWNLNVKVKFGSEQFNKWGVCTLATGTDPTPADNSEASKFNGGFQFYQNAASNNNRGLILKSNNKTNTITDAGMTETNGMIYLVDCTATFELKYRNGQLRIVLFTDNGISIDETYTTTLSEISNLCGKFGSDSEILGLTYNFINEESTEPVVATTWLNNENITIRLEDGYTGTYSIDENGSLWGSARQQQLLRVPSAAQLANKNNRFTVPESMLAISPDAFLNNPTAKVNIALQQYLMVDDLLKPGNVSLAMTETSDNEESLMNATEVTFAEVTLDRKPSAAKWNTFVLPFGISGDEMDAYISEAYAFSGITANGDNITINFTRQTGTLTAGEPYLVKGTTAAANGLLFANKSINVSPATKQFEAGDYIVKVHGRYDQLPIQGDNIFYVAQNKLYYAQNQVTLKGFRAYIQVQTATGIQVRAVGMSFDDIQTAVNSVGAADQIQVTYNLSGQRVTNVRGIVIRNGRKVIVK